MKLEAIDITASRSGRTIFAGINFSLAESEVLLVTGPNGAGKSTLLRVIAGLLPLDGGTLSLAPSGEYGLRENCHYLGHKNTLKESLTVSENLQFWRSLSSSPALAIDEALERINLRGIEDIPAGYLSAGQKRRVAIARLLVSRKPIWLVDEPTAALDKRAESDFSRLLQQHLDDGGIAIAATHQPLDLRSPRKLEMRAMSYDADSASEYY